LTNLSLLYKLHTKVTGGTIVGLAAHGLAKKLPLLNNSKNSKRVGNNKHGNTKSDNIDTHHNSTPSKKMLSKNKTNNKAHNAKSDNIDTHHNSTPSKNIY